MIETVPEKALCASCGVDVREGTQFCYNCGKPVTNGILEKVNNLEKVDVTNESISDKNQKPSEKAEKLATAAAERKKSRIGQRKPKKVVWEEPSQLSNSLFVLFCLLIAVISAGLVFLMVFVK